EGPLRRTPVRRLARHPSAGHVLTMRCRRHGDQGVTSRRVYATITRVATGGQQLQNATIVGEEMTGWLSEMQGFQGMLMLSRDGETLGISFWASQEDMDRQGALRAEFVERIAAVAQVEI